MNTSGSMPTTPVNVLEKIGRDLDLLAMEPVEPSICSVPPEMIVDYVEPEAPVEREKVEKIIEDRARMTAGAMPINWGYGETLAYATLLDQGYPVRLTGQDVGRGAQHPAPERDGARLLVVDRFASSVVGPGEAGRYRIPWMSGEAVVA